MNVSITTRSKIESVTITLNEMEARELHELLCYRSTAMSYISLDNLKNLLYARLEGR